MSYVPDMTGRYTITIKYGGDEIPYSPYRIHALPTGDASKCLVTGQTPPITALRTNQVDLAESLTVSLTPCFPTVSIGGHGPGESQAQLL